MSSIIDWHAHWIPPQLAKALRARTRAPRIIPGHGGEETLLRDEGAGTSQPVVPTFISLEERLRALDAVGVERQVISLPGFFGDDSLPIDEAADLAGAFNDGIGQLVVDHPDRFSGLAILPLGDPERAAHELERAHTELGLLGALLPVDAFLSLDIARSLAPVLETAERFESHLFIHPGSYRSSRWGEIPSGLDTAHYRSGVLDLQGRISSAYVTLAYTDLLTSAPHVTVQIANLGGALPFYAERLVNTAQKRGLADPIPPLRRFFVDTGSLSTHSIELAATILGADRVLFGTDDPIFSVSANAAGVRATGLTDAQKRGILSENGRAVLKKQRQPEPALS